MKGKTRLHRLHKETFEWTFEWMDALVKRMRRISISAEELVGERDTNVFDVALKTFEAILADPGRFNIEFFD